MRHSVGQTQYTQCEALLHSLPVHNNSKYFIKYISGLDFVSEYLVYVIYHSHVVLSEYFVSVV
jgi:hypothetical protein